MSAEPTPGGRSYSGGWRDDSGNLWIFGGNAYLNVTAGKRFSFNFIITLDSTNDLWMFNMTSLSWKYVGGPKTNRNPGHYSNDSLAWPGARNGHMTWSRNGEFWLFGGTETNGPSKSSKTLNFLKFEQIITIFGNIIMDYGLGLVATTRTRKN